MKKGLILGLLLISMVTSCDKIGYNEFTVINNCAEEIVISIIEFNDSTKNFNVLANDEYLFLVTDGGIPAKNPNLTESAFKQITITKNGKVSQKIYVNKENWKYVDIDDTLRKWYLHVNPEDFESN
jgi:hypothetical protein